LTKTLNKHILYAEVREEQGGENKETWL
jgi:hypothetical protein